MVSLTLCGNEGPSSDTITCTVCSLGSDDVSCKRFVISWLTAQAAQTNRCVAPVTSKTTVVAGPTQVQELGLGVEKLRAPLRILMALKATTRVVTKIVSFRLIFSDDFVIMQYVCSCGSTKDHVLKAICLYCIAYLQIFAFKIQFDSFCHDSKLVVRLRYLSSFYSSRSGKT